MTKMKKKYKKKYKMFKSKKNNYCNNTKNHYLV